MNEIRKAEWTMVGMMNIAAIALAALLILSTLTGCPAPGTLPTDDNGGGNGGGGTIEPQPELSKVVVSGQLYDATKVSIRDYGDLLKRQITSLNFYFYNGDYSQSFFVPVEDGGYYAELLIHSGIYNVWVEAGDAYGNVLFTDNLEFKVSSGENRLEVVLVMTEGYHYRFVMEGLPGEYDEYGSAIIKTNDGQTYYVWYSPQYLDGKGADPGPATTMVFDAWLPLDFDGFLSQAVLSIQDKNGKPYASALEFDLFDAVGGIMYVPYVYPEWMGDIYVDISFEYEQTTIPPAPAP